MNHTETDWTYEPVRIPSATPLIFGLIAPVLLVGIFLNMVTCYGVFRIRVESLLTRCLLLNECLFDMLVCILVFGTIIPCKSRSDSKEHDVFKCYVFRNAYLMTFTRMLMNFNIVCLACDRFWAIAYYSTYKQKRLMYLIVCYMIILVSSSIITIPNFFQVAFYDNTCVATPERFTIHAQMMLNIVLAYIFPVCVVLSTGLWASHLLRKQNRATTHLNRDNSLSQCNRVQNTLSTATCGFCLVFMILTIIGTVMSTLSILKLMDFRFDSILRMYFNCACGLASSSIPVIQMCTIPSLRRWFVGSIKSIHAWFVSVLRQMKTNNL
ncbi:hypothetical protein FBUS_01287 [Fasciolopsis buskii]|uniref:G-protein coupled receptors family 1 profile domain-containing protein n=1 Tax=Fasciolopsis buskii TaxID=27845 RepID=A0A8E0RMR8_9TREM|nr:hypothetical protein FBUS_01287 [Fasciolopsis buski]